VDLELQKNNDDQQPLLKFGRVPEILYINDQDHNDGWMDLTLVRLLIVAGRKAKDVKELSNLAVGRQVVLK